MPHLVPLHEKEKLEIVHQTHISFSIDALASHGKGNLRPSADNAIFVIMVCDMQKEYSKVINAGFRRVRILHHIHIVKELDGRSLSKAHPVCQY